MGFVLLIDEAWRKRRKKTFQFVCFFYKYFRHVIQKSTQNKK
jgi:hypothetical protein